MAVKSAESERWKLLKPALSELEDGLRCGRCNKVARIPQTYHCGHFFCEPCTDFSESLCPTCKVPSQAFEICPDRLVSDVIGCFKTLSSIVTPDRLDLLDHGSINDTNMAVASESIGSILRSRVKETVDDMKPIRRTRTSSLSSNNSKSGKVKASEQKKPIMSSDAVANTSAAEPIFDDDSFLKPAQVKKASTRVKNATKPGSKKNETSSKGSSTEGKSVTSLQDDDLHSNTPRSRKSRSNSVTSDTTDKKALSVKGNENIKSELTTPKRSRGRLPSKQTKIELNHSVVKSTPSRKSDTIGKELTKRNFKGETPLHLACIKGNVDRVKFLLEAKASPNTKDNAGWTPLHEASNHGFTEVVELLLKAGALVDVPGVSNVTPLHEAVINNHLAIVKLLVSYGADIHARSSDGKSPIDLVTSDEIKEALLNTKQISKSTEENVNLPKPNVTEKEMVLCAASDLEPEDKESLSAIASSLNVRLAHSFGPDVTHLIVPSDNGTCPPSLEVLSAILRGINILYQDWIKMSSIGTVVEDEVFEIAGVTDYQDAEAPKHSRLNAQKQLPGLFNGCHFFVTSNVQYKLSNCILSKSDVTTLIRIGGGRILKRQPDPEAIPVSEQTVPYHAPRSGALTETSHFILYSPGKGEPELKYNMKHCKSLPVEWFVNCVLNWQLMDP